MGLKLGQTRHSQNKSDGGWETTLQTAKQIFCANQIILYLCIHKTPIMTTTSTVEKVKNYQGQSRFLLNLKDSLKKYGGLTFKQLEAAEKTFNGEVKTIDLENLPEDLKNILNYEGESVFVKDISEKLRKFGTLTDKQKFTAMKAIQKEEDKKKSIVVHWATPGQTILVGRKVGQGLREKYGLEFNPMILDITEIIEVRPKAIRFKAKMTDSRGKWCCICNKTLTDELSMLSGVGKICSKHFGVPYLTSKDDAEQYRQNYLKRIEEIGEMEVWAPRTSIKKWEGGKAKIHQAAVDALGRKL